MMPMDIGMEAALNAGSPAPARDAGGTLQTWGGLNGRPGAAAEEGRASFHALLRAAAGADRSGSAVGRPEPADEAPAGRADASPALERFDSADSDPPASKADGKGLQDPQLQALLAVLAAAEAGMPLTDVSGDASEIRNAEDGLPTDFSGIYDRLKQLLEFADGFAGHPAAGTVRMAELLEKLKPSAENSAARLLPEELASLRQELSEYLRGLVWDGAADDAQEGISGTGPAKLELDGRFRPMTEPPAAGAVGRDDEVREISPAARASSAGIREAKLPDGGERPAKDNTAAGLRLRTAEPDSSTAGAAFPAALRAAHRQEAVPGGIPADSARPADAISESAGKLLDGRQDPPADSGSFRQAAEELLFSKAPAALDAASEEGMTPSERFALTPREVRPSAGAQDGSGRSAEAAAALRGKEALPGAVRSGVFDQIVQRAVVQVGNDRGEINIDLKPDFLGRVRMQIMAENQQVSVRILTELPAVRDLIETGLQQLKSELQSQGLQVERLEVAVADDHRQRGWQQARTARTWKAVPAGEISAAEPAPAEGRREPVYDRPRPFGAAAIDMFV
jgi:hypothetical protein